MKSYLIGYDLNKTGQDYDSLIEQIRNLALGGTVLIALGL